MPNLIIPPRDLPDAVDVFATDSIVVDNGSTVSKATPVRIVDAGRPWATIQEAQAGTASGSSMSPLTTAAAIAAQASGQVVFASYAAAEDAADSVPLAARTITAIVGGRRLDWVRLTGGPCLGGGWVPAGEANPEHFGAVADWNGTTGTDNTTALRAWLAYGKQCRGRAGRYRVTGGLEFRANNETLDGRGMEIVHDTAEISIALTAVDVTNSAIRGFTINGRKSLKSGLGVQSAHGIAYENCNGLTIEGNTIFECLEHGICGRSQSANMYVMNNRITNCGNAATQRGAGIFMFGGCDNAVVSGNMLFGNEWGLGYDDSSDPPRANIISRRVTITGNVVVGTNPLEGAYRFEGSQQAVITGNVGIGYGMGVQCRKIQSDRLSEQVAITGNTFEATRACISLSSSIGVTVTGNSLRVSVEDTSIERCCVEVYSQTFPRAERIVISGNTMETTQHGVLIGRSASHNLPPQPLVVVVGNIISYVSSTAAVNYYAVWASALRRVSVRDNEITGFFIGVVGESYVNGDLTIRGNEITGCVSHAIRLSPGGLATTSVFGNRTWGNGGGGLRLESSANRIETSIAYNHFAEGINGSASSTRQTANVV